MRTREQLGVRRRERSGVRRYPGFRRDGWGGGIVSEIARFAPGKPGANRGGDQRTEGGNGKKDGARVEGCRSKTAERGWDLGGETKDAEEFEFAHREVSEGRSPLRGLHPVNRAQTGRGPEE